MPERLPSPSSGVRVSRESSDPHPLEARVSGDNRGVRPLAAVRAGRSPPRGVTSAIETWACAGKTVTRCQVGGSSSAAAVTHRAPTSVRRTVVSRGTGHSGWPRTPLIDGAFHGATLSSAQPQSYGLSPQTKPAWTRSVGRCAPFPDVSPADRTGTTERVLAMLVRRTAQRGAKSDHRPGPDSCRTTHSSRDRAAWPGWSPRNTLAR